MGTKSKVFPPRARALMLAGVALVGWMSARTSAIQRGAQASAENANDIAVLPVQGNVSMIVTPAGNIAVSVGKNGVLVVDTGAAAVSDRVLRAIRGLSTAPGRYIINTSADADHTGG